MTKVTQDQEKKLHVNVTFLQSPGIKKYGKVISMKEIKNINLESAIEDDFRKFSVRDTVRAVIYDNNNNIALTPTIETPLLGSSKLQ